MASSRRHPSSREREESPRKRPEPVAGRPGSGRLPRGNLLLPVVDQSVTPGGSSTASITCTTPFDASTSGCTTFASLTVTPLAPAVIVTF